MRRLRNLIRYIIIIVLNTFIMLAFHSYVNFLLLAGLILFPFYSVYGVNKVKNAITLRLMLPEEPMEKENEFYLRFLLHNPTWFPLVNVTITLKVANRFYHEEGIHYLNVPVRAKKDTEVIYPIVMDYCGRFGVCAENIHLVDLLGIYETVIPIKKEKECLVFPNGAERRQEVGQIYARGVSEAMEGKEKGYDFSEISGIREYIPGDKLQNIHWKLSVKRDELMVKERISVSAMQLNVLVELANDEDMRLEAVLELADGVTKSLVAQNLPFTVYYYSTNLGILKDCYIGNEAERNSWMEMLLYDESYQDAEKVEEMFLQQSSATGSYLYIGYASAGEEENAIWGRQQTVAALRG